MRDFVFDQYGYYYDDADATEFVYQGYDFKLMAHSMSEAELWQMEEFVSEAYSHLPFNPHCHLVKSRSGQYGVETEFGSVCLVSALKTEYSLSELLALQNLGSNYHPKSPYTISNLITLWEEKLNLVEEKCVPYLKIDDFTYPIILKETIFAIGLCSNAIEYLTDLKNDYGDKISHLTFSHKRLYDFDSFDIFNPFNIVYDSPVRDLAFLYKEGKIELPVLLQLLENFELGQNEISLLMARAMFPTATFDILEDNFSLKKDIKIPIVKKTKSTKHEVGKLVLLHKSLVDKFKIRPINWLLNYEY